VQEYGRRFFSSVVHYHRLGLQENLCSLSGIHAVFDNRLFPNRLHFLPSNRLRWIQAVINKHQDLIEKNLPCVLLDVVRITSFLYACCGWNKSAFQVFVLLLVCLAIQASAVSVEDYGRDLAAIQALQRKQEDVEKDMTALFQQIQVHDQTSILFISVCCCITGK
jgi:hypothetical protein